jgi:hypothetical protein
MVQSDHDARRARLFEMIRQQDLSLRALKRLHLRVHHAQAQDAIPSPALLAASLMDQDGVFSSSERG